MHDVLRQRLLRKIESLPDEQVYQILDYIEFLESKYVTADGVSTSGLQKFAEGLEDKLRRRAVSPNTIREAFQLISAADRVLSGVSSAGRQILGDLGQALEVDEASPGPADQPPSDDDAQRIEADPRKRRSGARASTNAAETSGSPGRSSGGSSAGGSGGSSDSASGGSSGGGGAGGDVADDEGGGGAADPSRSAGS